MSTVPASPGEARPHRLRFDSGTLLIDGLGESERNTPGIPGVKFDFRTQEFRAEAIWYRTIVEHLRSRGIAYADEARAYDKTSWTLKVGKEPFPHQVEGLKAWWGPEAGASSSCRPGRAKLTWRIWRSSAPSGRPWSSLRRST